MNYGPIVSIDNAGVAPNGKSATAGNPLSGLRIKLFADSADKGAMLGLSANRLIRGFTTNPTLMRKAGVRDYAQFAREIVSAIPDRPISFEVIGDEYLEVQRQAHQIAGWGSNVYVKIPVTNTRGESLCPLVKELCRAGIKVNVTALLTVRQVRDVRDALAGGPPSCISVFAGRIADTGRDPIPVMTEALELLRAHRQIELIWASPREVLNVFQADTVGCHIITATSEILNKLHLVGKDLDAHSLETVKMFYDDAVASGFSL